MIDVNWDIDVLNTEVSLMRRCPFQRIGREGSTVSIF